MSLEGISGPAWLIALATAFLMGAKAVVWIKGGSNGHLAPELRSALQAVTVTLTALTERLAHLPTREDLSATAEKNRHAYRTDLTTATGGLSDQLTRAEANIIREIGRPIP